MIIKRMFISLSCPLAFFVFMKEERHLTILIWNPETITEQMRHSSSIARKTQCCSIRALEGYGRNGGVAPLNLNFGTR
jgi:hypothetical protein